VPGVGSPTVRRRELGAILRSLRLAHDMTVEDVAASLLCSPSKVSRMETGHRGVTQRDVRDLCDLYGVTDPDERERLMKLAVGGKQQGWWQAHELDYFSTYVGLEDEATAILQYHSSIVPGLLQSPDYVRIMADAVIPPMEPARIEVLVEVKLTRQRRLVEDPPLELSVVLDEAVLHRAVGGPAVMSAQMEHLAAVAGLSNVSVRIVPFKVGAHPAMGSAFNILTFASAVPPVVYVEGLVGFMYLERPSDVARYQQVYTHLSKISLTPQESIELIADIGARYRRAGATSKFTQP
jgi:transcriptional regulator with XRE-family HTH domain